SGGVHQLLIQAGKITVHFSLSGWKERGVRGLPAVFRRFPGAKNKSLILFQWATGGDAVLVLNKVGTLALEETAGVQVIVSKELPGSAVEVIGALAAYHRHVSTRIASALGGKR